MGLLGMLGGFLGTMFSSSKASDTAIDAIRKVGGLDDMAPEKRVTALLDYLKVTQGQSVTRRFIAFLMVSVYVLTILVYMVCNGLGILLGWSEYVIYANQTFALLTTVIKEPFNWVMVFYFGVQLKDMFKK